MSTITSDVRLAALEAVRPLHLGRVSGLLGIRVTVTGLSAAVGELLEIDGPAGVVPVEVVASAPGVLTCL
ncbi:MAG: EscN/YscN/HrcN family type III secretion system ATPase, partial [Actinomycetales bacterium]